MSEIPMQCRDCRMLEICLAANATKEKPCASRMPGDQSESVRDALEEMRCG